MTPTLVSYGGKGKSYWGQVQCVKCSAWLREMPDRYEFRKSNLENTDEFYHYFWKCLACGYEREVEELSSPDSFQPNPDADIKEPGIISNPIEENPDKLKNSAELSPLQNDIFKYYSVCFDYQNKKVILERYG